MGFELFVQDERGVWSLFNSSGSMLINQTDRTGSSNRFTGDTGVPFKIDLDGNGDLELLVPCMDGHLRKLDFVNGQITVTVLTTAQEMAGCGRAVRVVEPVGAPTPYAIVGTDQAKLYSVNVDTGEIVYEYPTGFDPVLSGVPVAIEVYDEINQDEILVAHGNRVEVFLVDTEGHITNPAPRVFRTIPGLPTPTPDAPSQSFVAATPPEISSLELYGGYVYVSLPHGRIFILNRSDLNFTRTTANLGVPSGYDPLYWHANQTLAHAFGVSQIQDETDPTIYVHDARVTFMRPENNAIEFFRVASLDPVNGSMVDYALLGQAFVDQPPRGFVVFKKQNELMTYFPRENAGYLKVGEEPGALRYGYETFPFPPGSAGYISEWDLHNVPDQFGITRVTWLRELETFKLGTNEKDLDEDYPPVEGPNKRDGQISTTQTASTYLGHVVKVGLLRALDGSGSVPHVIVGTAGGLVYAVDPTKPNPSGLSYYTHDVGWNVIGMDIADLDDDGFNEVIIGIWLDKGDLLDFQADPNDPQRNRGHLVILKTPTTGTFSVAQKLQEIHYTFDTGIDAGPITSGIFGIKVDDIDGDGTKEIWVGDAIGYLYAVQVVDKQNLTLRSFYRSKGLGVYAGLYNNIFPVKEDGVHTNKLVVFTSGYAYRFSVAWPLVP
jgi:hypothetical protein